MVRAERLQGNLEPRRLKNGKEECERCVGEKR